MTCRHHDRGQRVVLALAAALSASGCGGGGGGGEVERAVKTVPDVRGQRIADARRALENRGLRVTITQRRTNEVRKGVIQGQKPRGGQTVKPGTTINVIVSKGGWPQPVPSGRYAGTTSQGKPISFRISRDGTTMTQLKFLVVMTRCGTGAFGSTFTYTVTYPVAAQVRANGRFRSSEGPGGSVFQGRFRNSRLVTGALRARLGGPDFPNCASGGVKWTARLTRKAR